MTDPRIEEQVAALMALETMLANAWSAFVRAAPSDEPAAENVYEQERAKFQSAIRAALVAERERVAYALAVLAAVEEGRKSVTLRPRSPDSADVLYALAISKILQRADEILESEQQPTNEGNK
jgi:2,3-bisphosphoglycerate-independent phosphoglycerate mutase